MTSVEKMIEENNTLREKLNPENEKFYGEVLVNLRLANKSEQATEETLLDILQDLIQAQGDGVTAVDFFGKEPKTLCQDIAKELPALTWRDKISYIWIAITAGAFILLYQLMPTFNSGKLRFSLLSMVMLLAGTMVFIIALLGYMRRSTFQSNKKTSYIIPGLMFALYILGVALWEFYMPKMLPVTIKGWPLIFIYVVLFAIAFIGLWQEKIKLYSLWGLLIVMLLTAIVMHFHLIPFLANKKVYAIYSLVILIGYLIALFIEPFILSRKNSK